MGVILDTLIAYRANLRHSALSITERNLSWAGDSIHKTTETGYAHRSTSAGGITGGGGGCSSFNEGHQTLVGISESDMKYCGESTH